ncbi:MAG: transglycosylase [Ktedonobacteraceae bacterium]|nr:transglycosylase [Chloroflexota bacterium]
MAVTLVQFIIWLVIAAIIGFLGEFIAGRRAPAGFIGAITLGLLAIFLIVGFLHFHIIGEPTIEGVPLISTIIAAIMLVSIWGSVSYSRRIRS